MPRETVALSYHDICLRSSDVQLLGNRLWLNDQIIGFALEYLERSLLFKDEGGNSTRAVHRNARHCVSGTDNFVSAVAAKIALVKPSIAQLIRLYADQEALSGLIDDFGWAKKDVLIIPVNDNETVDAGGFHWSLLICWRKDHKFVHFDSLGDYNIATAQSLANIVDWCWNNTSGLDVEIIRGKCPYQTNGHDCGVYVILFAEYLLRQYLARQTSLTVIPSSSLMAPEEKRSQLRLIISHLAGSC
jgi:sentrin-specific protease 8